MKKKIKILIIILILILMFLILKSTYSKYTNKTEANLDAIIGQWNIKINDKDITKPNENPEEKEIKFTIDNTNFIWDWEKHPNVMEGKVAPGMEGLFYIKIDPTGTDTSLKYEFILDASKIKDTPLIIKEVALENGKTFDSITKDEKDIYTGIRTKKLLEEIQNEDENVRCDRIVVKLKWEENDEKDAELAKEAYKDEDISFPVILKAIQYTGE